MGVRQTPEQAAQIKDILNIPRDEPIFIFRAQDEISPEVLAFYGERVHHTTKFNDMDEDFYKWLTDVGSQRSDFVNWQRNNRQKVKRPD